jgi:tetratricopeptide (TPR) repeat protein
MINTQRLSITIATTITICLLSTSLALAKEKKPKPPKEFPPNPLEITVPDPLLPRDANQQPLTVEEKRSLEAQADKLNQQATAKLQAGDSDGAFTTWNRELRLRRYLGTLAEIEALQRVGGIAYTKNNRQQIRYITERLQTIQKQVQQEQTPEKQVLQALGEAYLQVRSPNLAVSVYNQVLIVYRESSDLAGEIDTLKTIAKVHLGWFDYPAAATTYEQLINLVTNNSDIEASLKDLVYIYERTKQPLKAIDARQELSLFYRQRNDIAQLSALKLAIGSDYELLAKENPNLIDEAFKNYQEAYTMAWEFQQYVAAAEALQKLVSLYIAQGQIEDALQTSQILLQAEERASNFYGMMNAYEQIGKIHLQRQENQLALAAFQKGLELAQQLGSQTDEFTQQIQKISGRSPNQT